MPYDPTTGTWNYQDDSVEGAVKGLVDTNSPLIQQARTQGVESANRRGLINSSIAAGASQGAAYTAALPIAEQDSTQTSQKNLSEQGNVQTQQQQAITIKGQSDLQAQSDKAANDRLVEQLGSQAAVSAAQDAAAKDRLGMQLTSTEQQQVEALNNATKIATQNNTTTLNAAQIGATTNTSNTDKTIAAQTTVAISSAVANARTTYTSAINALAANSDIPVGARQGYLDTIEANYKADLHLIGTLYNVQIPYTPPVVAGTPAADPTIPSYA